MVKATEAGMVPRHKRKAIGCIMTCFDLLRLTGLTLYFLHGFQKTKDVLITAD